MTAYTYVPSQGLQQIGRAEGVIARFSVTRRRFAMLSGPQHVDFVEERTLTFDPFGAEAEARPPGISYADAKKFAETRVGKAIVADREQRVFDAMRLRKDPGVKLK